MLLYIHGFQGSPGDKFDRARRIFGDIYAEMEAPQLRNVSFAADMKQLNTVLPPEESGPRTGLPHLIIGNSLGGFYAWSLCMQREDSVCLLLNPSLVPFLSLKKFRGVTTKFLRLLFQEFTSVYRKMWQGWDSPKIWAAYCLDDELIAHRESTELILKPSKRYRWTKPTLFPVERGGHKFEDVQALEKAFGAVKRDLQENDYLEEIRPWYGLV